MKIETKTTSNYIKAIADARSISVAAENMGVSQPALSAQLKKLEAELGMMLFDRSKQPLELTEAGRAYLEFLDKEESLKRELRQNLSDIEGLNKGSIVVGGASFFNAAYMARAIASFTGKYPEINISTKDDMVKELAAAAQKGQLDIFITPFNDEKDRFIYEELIEEKIYLAVPASWKINDRLKDKAVDDNGKCTATLTAEDVRELCKNTFVVLREEQYIGKKMEALFDKYGCRPAKTIGVEQVITAIAFTHAGVGVSMVASSEGAGVARIVRKNDVRLYIPDSKLCSRKLYIAYPRNKYLSKAAKEFIRVLKEENR